MACCSFLAACVLMTVYHLQVPQAEYIVFTERLPHLVTKLREKGLINYGHIPRMYACKEGTSQHPGTDTLYVDSCQWT